MRFAEGGEVAPTFYHYTCAHGHAALGRYGTLLPGRTLQPAKLAEYWPARFVWLTDLATPIADALGLTREFITCDRTVHRYRVLEDRHVVPWKRHARHAGPWRHLLEEAPGARPRHWYMSADPVSVVHDPIGKRGALL